MSVAFPIALIPHRQRQPLRPHRFKSASLRSRLLLPTFLFFFFGADHAIALHVIIWQHGMRKKRGRGVEKESTYFVNTIPTRRLGRGRKWGICRRHPRGPGRGKYRTTTIFWTFAKKNNVWDVRVRACACAQRGWRWRCWGLRDCCNRGPRYYV